MAWSSVSGTYAVPDGYLDQAALPLELFWTFVEAADVALLDPSTPWVLLRQGHALAKIAGPSPPRAEEADTVVRPAPRWESLPVARKRIQVIF